jgi:hypothetical protein
LWGGERPVEVGRAAGGRAGGPGGGVRAARGSGQRGSSLAGVAVGGAEQQRNREGGQREEDNEDFSVIFQKSKGCTVK